MRSMLWINIMANFMYAFVVIATEALQFPICQI